MTKPTIIARIKPEKRAFRATLRADGYWVDGPDGQGQHGPFKSPQTAALVCQTFNKGNVS